MKKTILFAIDGTSKEVIVSESQKGSTSITFIERIPADKNELLYDAVKLLTKASREPKVNMEWFQLINQVCQLIYQQHGN